MNRIPSATIRRLNRLFIACLALLAIAASPVYADGKPSPPVTNLPCLLSPETKGVVVLFSGSEAELTRNFTQTDGTVPTWQIRDGGFMTAQNGDIVTKRSFGDFQLHVEFNIPYMPNAQGQERANSGVILEGAYELKIRDSFGIAAPSKSDCGAIYNAYPPLFNVCKLPKEWQSYDIIFRAPRIAADGVTRQQNARLTVFLNGVLVQNNAGVACSTDPQKVADGCEIGPIALQFHGSPMAFRNIWVLPLNSVKPQEPAASPVSKAVASGTGASPTPRQAVYRWQEVPQGLKVPVQRVRFDAGGYQIYSTTGETIAVPFQNQNLYAMKFGRSDGQTYFVNDGSAPVLYLSADGYLDSAFTNNTAWFPLLPDFAYSSPVYISPAPNWNAYTAMGWYPGMVVYGGMWSYNPNAAYAWMPGYGVTIDGTTYASYAAYWNYLSTHPGYVRNRVVFPVPPPVSPGNRSAVPPSTGGFGGGIGGGIGIGGGRIGFGGRGGGWRPIPPRRNFPPRLGGNPQQVHITGGKRRH